MARVAGMNTQRAYTTLLHCISMNNMTSKLRISRQMLILLGVPYSICRTATKGQRGPCYPTVEAIDPDLLELVQILVVMCTQAKAIDKINGAVRMETKIYKGGAKKKTLLDVARLIK